MHEHIGSMSVYGKTRRHQILHEQVSSRSVSSARIDQFVCAEISASGARIDQFLHEQMALN